MTNLEKLRLFMQDAPHHSGMAPRDCEPHCVGMSGDDFTLCDECLGRLLARGCAIPVPNRLLWSDRHPTPVCDLREFHG
jgi:hypothetical protein